MRILLAVKPADFRKGIDGLAQLCQQHLESDPFSGAVFVFRNKRATALKIHLLFISALNLEIFIVFLTIRYKHMIVIGLDEGNK